MNIREAFMADIIANPADDTPRLILADWLEENGEEERGEFIRVQCQLSAWNCSRNGRGIGIHRCNPTKNGPACEALRKRERVLLVSWPAHPRWYGGPDPFINSHPHRDISLHETAIRCHGLNVKEVLLGFSRGFVSHVTLSSADFLQHGPAVVSAQPITSVTLTDWEVVAHEDMNDFETDKFLVRMQTGSLGAANLWNALSEYIPTLHDDAAEALATFSQTLILWGRSRIKSTALLPLG